MLIPFDHGTPGALRGTLTAAKNDFLQERGEARAASFLKTCNRGGMHFLLRNKAPRQLITRFYR